jgi:hypothetical protein
MAQKSKAYCWITRLVYRCGCTEESEVDHNCGGEKTRCAVWRRTQKLDKDCGKHRSGGLQGDN